MTPASETPASLRGGIPESGSGATALHPLNHKTAMKRFMP
jgi:hypothetical protein